MIAPITLFALAVALAFVGPRLLRARGWAERSPRLGIAAWQALSVSLVTTVFLIGASLAVPAVPWTADIAELLRACAMVLRQQYSTPGGVIISATGALAALIVLARVAYCLTRCIAAGRREQQRQRAALNLIARPHAASEASIIDHAVPAAYCLPGRGHRIVLTSSALSALDPRQVAAVLAHERAHLRGRHHLILAVADALHAAFPGVAAFTDAQDALRRLVEMLADDTAAQHNGRLTVATALVNLGSARTLTPAAALGAGGTSTVARVKRLLGPAEPLGARRGAGIVALTAALLLLPVLLAVAPASAAGGMPPCAADHNNATM